MPSDPTEPASPPGEKSGIGIFQLLGFGLLLLFVLVLLVMAVGSLFISAE